MLELRGPIGGWFIWDSDVPRPVPRSAAPGVVPARRDAAHGAPARSRRPAARRRGRPHPGRARPTPPSCERYGATLALTRARTSATGRRAPSPPRSSRRCSRASSSATSAARPASRRTPRTCCSRAVSTRRPSASSASDRRATEARIRPRDQLGSAAGPGVHEVSTRAATEAVHPPDRTPRSTVHREGLRETGNSGATSIRGELVAPLSSPLQRREGRTCYGSGAVRGSGARRSPRCCPTTRFRRRWTGTT